MTEPLGPWPDTMNTSGKRDSWATNLKVQRARSQVGVEQYADVAGEADAVKDTAVWGGRQM